MSYNSNKIYYKTCQETYGEHAIDIGDNKCICEEGYLLNYNKICEKDPYYDINNKISVFVDNSLILLFMIGVLVLIYMFK